MQNLVRTLAVLLAIGSAAPANAVTYNYLFGYTGSGQGSEQLILNGGATVLNATDTGWVQNQGSPSGPTNQNYFVGSYTGFAVGDATFRDFFSFDLSSVTGPIQSAYLSIFNPDHTSPHSSDYGYLGTSNIFTVHDANAVGTLLTAGIGSVAAYNAMAGTVLGATQVDSSVNGKQVIIPLNSFALAALSALEGHSFVFSGTLDAVPLPAGLPMFVVALLAISLAVQWRKYSKA